MELSVSWWNYRTVSEMISNFFRSMHFEALCSIPWILDTANIERFKYLSVRICYFVCGRSRRVHNGGSVVAPFNIMDNKI